MSTWTKQKISQVAIEKREPYFPSPNEHLPCIELEHIEQQSLKLSSVGDSAVTASQKKKFKSCDVLYGSLRPYFRKIYKPKFDGVCSSDITVLSSNKNSYPGYLFYLVANRDFIEKASSSSNGTKMPRAGSNIIKDFEFNIPDLPTQTRIASVLSAYDDLIENNEKRIKALEEMAELLYIEWFVKFKFPGHEKIKLVDSGTSYGKIPEGWKIKKFAEIFDIKYGKNLPTSKINDTGKYKVYGAGGVIGYYDQKNIETKTSLVTCRGNGSGTVWRTSGEGFVTNNAFTINGKENFIVFEFIFNTLKNCNINSSISGSAQPQITIENINFVQLLIPPKDLVC